MKKYTLDFYEALKQMLENGAWIKGDDFMPGIYLKLDKQGQIVLVDASKFSIETPYGFLGGLTKQKFRIITIATVKELSF